MFTESETQAADKARTLFDRRIERGRASGASIIEKIQKEVPQDMVVKSEAIKLHTTENGLEIMIDDGVDGMVRSIHPWALQQASGRAGVPWRYISELSSLESTWSNDLIATNINELLSRKNSRYLLRSVNGQVRGFLSDRYKRLDSRPLIEAFAKASVEIGAVPINGYSTDTKVGLTAVLPRIYEPVPNEPLSFGVHWENSDFGNGKHTISGFIDRAWCTNGMIMNIGFSQIHLGKRLQESIFLSERTHQLDTMTTASAIMDTVKRSLSSDMIDIFCNTVKEAHETEIDPALAIKSLAKDLTKKEAEMISTSFNSANVVMLPPGNTTWRLSNAISWVAGNEIESTERTLDLLKLAGAVLTMKKIGAVRVR